MSRWGLHNVSGDYYATIILEAPHRYFCTNCVVLKPMPFLHGVSLASLRLPTLYLQRSGSSPQSRRGGDQWSIDFKLHARTRLRKIHAWLLRTPMGGRSVQSRMQAGATNRDKSKDSQEREADCDSTTCTAARARRFCVLNRARMIRS